MSQLFNVSKGYILFVAQIFSTFLLHAQLFQGNIPTNVQSQFSTLIESTCEEIKNISVLKEKEAKIAPLQSAVLLLHYAIGEVKLLYSSNHGSLPNPSNILQSEEVFDFSILHDSLSRENSSFLESFMNSDNKMLSFLVFQLILQKLRALNICSNVSETFESSLGKDSTGMQKSISCILKYLQESCTASDSWDMDLCSINSTNYGSAYWKAFLKISPFLFYHFSWKDIYTFCNSAQSIILQNNEHENGAKYFILSTLRNREFQEFQHYQTAFVCAMWIKENLLSCKKRSLELMETEQSPVDKLFILLNTYTSKSLKYAQRTPKNKKSGSLWREIKEISDILNLILSSESLPKDKLIVKNTSDIVKFLSFLPLECVLPGNQMKCLIGLSLLFFLVPQSCKSSNAITLAREISQQLLTIFDGARSIWLFDFVNSGPYLKFIVKTIESIISDECEEDNEWAVELLECVISLAVRYVESLHGIKSYLSEIYVKNNCSRSTLITLYALLKKFAEILPKNKQGNYKETLITLSTLAVQCFIKQMNLNFKDDMNSVDHCYFIKCYMQSIEIPFCCPEAQTIGNKSFELLPKVLEKALNIVQSSNLDILNNAYLLLLSKICKHSSKLSGFLPENFISIAWKIMLSHFEEKRKKTIAQFLADPSQKSSTVESTCVSDSSLCALCSIYAEKLSTESCKKNVLLPLTLNDFEEESLKELSIATPSDMFPEVFHTLLKEMNCLSSATKDMFSLQLSLLMFQSVFDANSDKCAEPLFCNILQKCLSQLNYIVNQACSSYVCQTMVMIPVLDFIDFIIVKRGKGLPGEVLLQSLHSIAPLPLEVQDDNYDLFNKSYNAVWKVVYNLFMHHTSVVMSSQAPFLFYVSKLLKSIVKAGAAEPLSRCDAHLYQQVQLCAQNMNRLLTVIARNENEFSKLVPYLVADYVDTVQHITLESSVKESILSGIFRLLDICSEQSIKMLAVNINYVCREIYTNLVNYYKQNKS